MPQTRIGNLIPGHTWLDGSGLPLAAVGSKFQYYVNNLNQDVYQKQDEITWIKIGNLSGGGGGWISGSGIPDGSLGLVGNWYEDIDNGNTYEKTGAVTWILRGDIVENPNVQQHIADVTTNPHAVTAAQTGAEPANANIQAHIADVTSNPHAVTAAQTGAEPANANIQAHIADVTSNPHKVAGVWFAGLADPTTGIGNVNDFYVNVTSKNVFYQSDVDVWDLIGNLGGGGGGSSVGIWLSGNGVPDPALSVIGNWYVDMDLWEVYKKTDAVTWSFYGSIAPVNLVRDLIGSVFVPAGYTMTQYHIELAVGALFTVNGRLYYRTLDTTNGTLDSTGGTLALI